MITNALVAALLIALAAAGALYWYTGHLKSSLADTEAALEAAQTTIVTQGVRIVTQEALSDELERLRAQQDVTIQAIRNRGDFHEGTVPPVIVDTVDQLFGNPDAAGGG